MEAPWSTVATSNETRGRRPRTSRRSRLRLQLPLPPPLLLPPVPPEFLAQKPQIKPQTVTKPSKENPAYTDMPTVWRPQALPPRLKSKRRQHGSHTSRLFIAHRDAVGRHTSTLTIEFAVNVCAVEGCNQTVFAPAESPFSNGMVTRPNHNPSSSTRSAVKLQRGSTTSFSPALRTSTGSLVLLSLAVPNARRCGTSSRNTRGQWINM